MKKPELLAPAGSLEKLKIAVAYGADAVYFGGEVFNLRNFAKNFSLADIKEALEFLHKNKKKGYLTLNIYPRNYDIPEIINYLKKLKDLNLDGIIVSNLAVLKLVKEYLPNVEIHISTQANAADYISVNEWAKLGASRVIVARELTLSEVKNIVEKSQAEVEMFIHGAMCMAYSGRCMMSKYMANRDANQGTCAQPCRWKYYVREETRKDELFEVQEDEKGTYIFNSKDLMLFDYMEEIINSGVVSLKIEGRNKGFLYLATVVNSYRQLIDAVVDGKEIKREWRQALFDVSNRGYHEGFIQDRFGGESNLASSRQVLSYDLLGYINEDGLFLAKASVPINKEFTYVAPNDVSGSIVIEDFIDQEGESVEIARASRLYKLKTKVDLPPYSVLRLKVK